MERIIKNKKLLVVVLLLITAGARAQQKSAAADTGTVKLASDLSVNKEKAAQLNKVLGYSNTELRALISNTSMPPKERQAAIQRLQQERWRRIDSALTPPQKAAYMQRLANTAARVAAAQAKLQQQSSEQLKQQ